jgi:hypothetical protein
MTAPQTPVEVRRQLLRGGFIPLPLHGKAPVIEAWQKHHDTTEHEIEFWSRTHPAAQNTGILTRLTPTLDIDILDPEAAEAVEDLVRGRLEERGRILVRFGKPPKRAIPFRTLAPFPKIVANFAVPDGASGEKLEMLCDGQQVVVDGIHPDTHQPYTWVDRAPGEIKHDDLPLIDAEGAQTLVDHAARLLVEKFGYRRKTPKPQGNGAGGGEGQADWGIAPDVLMDHDKCTALAMRLVKSGMGEGAAVNFLRAQVAGLTNVDEERRARRLKEIPGMVSSAQAKRLEPPPPDEPPPEAPPPGGPPPETRPPPNQSRVSLDDFWAYMLQHNYIFAPTGELWPGASVNSRIPPICVGTDSKGKPIMIPASAWLDRTKPVEQMTWAPGEPMLIHDQLITGGGWIDRPSATVFNLYRGPTLTLGDAAEAGPWYDHVCRVYLNDARHIICYLAHRVQRPQEKINHALVLGGPQGIGKDTLIEPIKRAVGPWNVSEVSPPQLLGRFNGFLKSVILRVSEARDLGEVNRYQFYDHLKAIIAAPPDLLRIDEKHLREYSIPNCVGVVITTNHKTDGIFLPADDRRHYVAWSELTKDDFAADYWTKLWRWYEDGGFGHVAANLASLDLSGFDPKAPPPKTQAFWDIVDANRAPEDAELADVIDALALKDEDGKPVPGSPVAFTLAAVLAKAEALTPSTKTKDGQPVPGAFAHWLGDRRNRRQIPHRFEQSGYTPVRNDAAKDGLWKVGDARQVIYALASLSLHDRLAAAKLVHDSDAPVLELYRASR